MTDTERTLLLLVAASVRTDLLSPWSPNKPHDATARAESMKDLIDKVQDDAKAANDNQKDPPLDQPK